MKNTTSVTVDLGGNPLTIEAGLLAQQAAGSVTVRYGDTILFSAVTGTDKPREGIDYFPLQVEYREKFYAAGRFPGGFFKREARPSEKEVLTARLTDRPIRPLFPADYRNDVQINNMLLSSDGIHDSDVLSIIAASSALTLSDIPFQGPIAGVRVARVDGAFVVNPTHEQREGSDLQIIYCGTRDLPLMIEADCEEAMEADVVAAMRTGHEAVVKLIDAQLELRRKMGLPDKELEDVALDTTLLDKARALRKVSRILRVHLRQRRSATVGPDLSHKRTLVNQVLRAPGVQRAIEAEAGDDRDARMLAEKKAREYALEIAADISYPTIRIVERLLKRVWHQIYDGIELNHVDQLQQVAEGQEVVYVPCHRSHFDYLLLGYVVYEEGLHIPHVAAGINLNLPVVGSILRRGGAFFLRRTFKGNKLYAAVFDAYLHQVIRRGHSMEYFIEGGRSRTGRLLEPKGGMLVMTVHSFVKDPRRPIVFVPVYFGYERLIEGDAFISELGGAAKEKESLFGLVRSLRSLREHYGKV